MDHVVYGIDLRGQTVQAIGFDFRKVGFGILSEQALSHSKVEVAKTNLRNQVSLTALTFKNVSSNLDGIDESLNGLSSVIVTKGVVIVGSLWELVVVVGSD